MPEERQPSIDRRARAEDRSRDAEDEKFWTEVAERDQGDPQLDGSEPGHEDRRARKRRARSDFEPGAARVGVRRQRSVEKQLPVASGQLPVKPDPASHWPLTDNPLATGHWQLTTGVQTCVTKSQATS